MAKMMAQEEEMAHREMLLAQKRKEGKRRCLAQEEVNLAACMHNNLRCPVVVILGHIDTGKTKLLDKIRKRNIKEAEVGGSPSRYGQPTLRRRPSLPRLRG